MRRRPSKQNLSGAASQQQGNIGGVHFVGTEGPSDIGMVYDESQDSKTLDVDVIFTVFFCGTSGVLTPATTQIGSFYRTCLNPRGEKSGGRVVELFEKDLETDIDAAESIIKAAAEQHATTDGGPTTRHFLIAFNGCGQTDGVPGTLFAVGLKRQCRAVVRYVDFIIEHFVNKTVKETNIKC